MEKNIEVIPDPVRLRSITVHPEMLKDLKIDVSISKQIQYGIRSNLIEILVSDKLKFNQVSLSTDMITLLEIPLNCQFEMNQMEDVIQLGPYIGLLAGLKQDKVKKRLNELLDYLVHYSEIEGAIIVFSLDKVNDANHTVGGFLYNPVTKGWDEGIFPYPSSVYIITGTISSKWIGHFQSVIGDSVFNDFYLNKWGVHEILASSPQMKEFLPTSILYKGPRDVYSFLKKYQSIIIKAINASRGSSIYKIELKENYLNIIYPKTGETTKLKLKNKMKVNQFLKNHLEEDKYMIQQALQLISYENRTIDFRLIVLKDSKGQWQVMGMFARHGQPGNILSNVSPILKLGDETLKEVLELNNNEVELLIQKINKIAIDAVKAIEKSGVHFANTGVDISIDKNNQIHIIEIQHCNPDHDIALDAGFPELYYEILKNNLLYAKKLAGF